MGSSTFNTGYQLAQDIASNSDAITNKLNGVNDDSNNKVEFRNKNGNVSFITEAKNPSATNPSVFIDINPADKLIYFYKDIGSGYVLFSTLPLP